MGKTLYLECESGISGDMTVAALLDLGADQQVLKKALASLPVQGFDIRISRVKKSGLDACDFDVVLDKEHENHDHDMEYLHGHTHATEHMHGHDVHNHDAEYIHEHRSFVDILQIIESSSLTERAKKTATDIFSVLADAEAKAHGVPRNQVYFHEVGAVDSIVDILSVAVCLDNLDIDQVIVTELCEGRGTVRCQHGILPIPVPAVTNIVQANHLKLKLTQIEGELVTPTGAAIVAAIRTSDKLPESFFIEKTGLGAGKRGYACAGILRAMILESENEKSWMEKDEICKLETNIDDCSGEALGFLMERLMQVGAKDVHYTPVYMKKNRPAYQVNVICKKEDAEKLEKLIFQGTTTIGRMGIGFIRNTKKSQESAGKPDCLIMKLAGYSLTLYIPNGIMKKATVNRSKGQDLWTIENVFCSVHWSCFMPKVTMPLAYRRLLRKRGLQNLRCTTILAANMVFWRLC